MTSTVLATFASLAVPAAQSEEPVAPASQYTEEQIYTEPHNAAAGAVGTTNFIVGRLTRDCREVLEKPDGWVKEFFVVWQGRNATYVQAATKYLANYLSYIERTKGAETKQAAMQEMLRVVRGEGGAAVDDMLSKGDKKETCTRLVGKIEAGDFDIGPNYPLFKEINEIVAILKAFS